MLDGSVATSLIGDSVRPRIAPSSRPKSISTSTIDDRALDRRPQPRSTRRGDPRRMIETRNLTKRLGGRTVVDGVSFRVEPGTVTGFLRANGAGKTTTLRMLAGLSRPDDGDAIVLGGPYRELPNPGRRVGVLLDASAQHAGR